MIISSGYLNRWQFPHQVPLASFAKIHASVRNTAEVGAVTLRWTHTGEFLGIDSYNRDIKPRWYRSYE